MKHFSFIIVSFLFVVAAKAEIPTGFADITFGATTQKVQTAFSKREGVNPVSNTTERLTYTGGTFGGQPVTLWTLNFADGKFASGSVLMAKVKKPVYDDLKTQLSKKYGKNYSEKGHHSFECLWEFRSNGRKTVRLEYEYMGNVIVTYSHDGITKKALESKKSEL